MSTSSIRQTGFGVLPVVAVVLVVAVTAGVGFLIFNKNNDTKTAATTPTDSSAPKQELQQQSGSPEPSVDPYAGMKQYTNTKYNLSFYYPADWRVEERDPMLTMDPERTELSVWLINVDAKADASTAVVTVVNRSLDEMTRSLDADLARFRDQSGNKKTDTTVKGKTAVKYSIMQPENVSRERYYIGAANKTYSIETIDERINLERDAKYFEKFNTVAQSLQVR